LNQRCVSAPAIESILLARRPKIFLQQNLPGSDIRAIVTVILHGKFQPPVQAPQGNLCSACSSVACIAQSLLRDAKEAQRHVLRQCIGNVPGVHLQSNWTLREALALGFQRFDQAEVFEDGGMEAIRKACMSSLSCASG
jgi:hypothetical protein